jgi:hypothetical protein
MVSLTTALTIAIAAGAIAQALFAGGLLWIQFAQDRERKRSQVAVALDLKGSPTRAFLRFENASPSGVLLKHVLMVANGYGRTADPVKKDFRFSISEYASREVQFTNEIFAAAKSIDDAHAAWKSDNAPFTAFVTLTPSYRTIHRKDRKGESVTYRMDFIGQSLQSATVKED